jgi:hypothetical protein
VADLFWPPKRLNFFPKISLNGPGRLILVDRHRIHRISIHFIFLHIGNFSFFHLDYTEAHPCDPTVFRHLPCVCKGLFPVAEIHAPPEFYETSYPISLVEFHFRRDISTLNRFSDTILFDQISWQPPRWIRDRDEKHNQMIRDHLHILVDGEEVPPICTRFVDLKLPPSIISGLGKKGITKPSPIQAQGLPVILSGRDMIGVAHTGSGKTLVFSLPAVMLALEEEMKLPIVAGEGPFSLVRDTKFAPNFESTPLEEGRKKNRFFIFKFF